MEVTQGDTEIRKMVTGGRLPEEHRQGRQGVTEGHLGTGPLGIG